MNLYRVQYYQRGAEKTAFVVAASSEDASAHVAKDGIQVLGVLQEKANLQVAQPKVQAKATVLTMLKNEMEHQERMRLKNEMEKL